MSAFKSSASADEVQKSPRRARFTRPKPAKPFIIGKPVLPAEPLFPNVTITAPAHPPRFQPSRQAGRQQQQQETDYYISINSPIPLLREDTLACLESHLGRSLDVEDANGQVDALAIPDEFLPAHPLGLEGEELVSPPAMIDHPRALRYIGLSWAAIEMIGQMWLRMPRSALSTHRGLRLHQLERVWRTASRVHPQIVNGLVVGDDLAAQRGEVAAEWSWLVSIDAFVRQKLVEVGAMPAAALGSPDWTTAGYVLQDLSDVSTPQGRMYRNVENAVAGAARLGQQWATYHRDMLVWWRSEDDPVLEPMHWQENEPPADTYDYD